VTHRTIAMGCPLFMTCPAPVPPARPIEFPSVPAHFEATAQTCPDRVALRTPTGDVTYAQLLATARQWARPLPARTAALVDAPMVAPTVAAIFGLFTAGTTVVTVDPATPPNRVDTIAAILADHDHHVVRIDPCRDGPAPVTTAAPALGPDDVTSIQFTSGSTGTPKAVRHTHGLWLADAQLLGARFGLADGARVALCMPISFAGGLNVLIGSLLGGAEVIGIDPREHTGPEALRRISSSGAEIITCTPAFIDVLHTAARGTTLARVRRIVVTGEAAHVRHIKLARELAPRAVFTNWAGSTETLAIASHDIAPTAPLPAGVVPVGVPAPHKSIVVDEDGAVTITSRHLGGGYLDPRAATASFVKNPDATTTYAGGDVGRWDADGDLVLSGRADSTVKIRGYLVEPAEIETTLLSYPDVREAVVKPDPERAGLIAYLAPSTTTRTPSVAELRTRLHRDLPPWMVPAHLVVLPALPRGDRGKIDRAALPQPTRPAYAAPRTHHESLVSRVWAEVLHVDRVGRTDSFYALGGDSMSVVQMIVALREAHAIVVAPTDLAAAPTVAEFAARITATGRPVSGLQPTTVALRPLSANTSPAPLFCFTGAGASALCFAPLAQRVGPGQAVYAFEPKGLQRHEIPDLSVRRAARRHLRDVRRVQPDGPYTLIGHSLGAHIALEVAHLLEAEGADVELVVMLDPWLSPKVAKDARAELPDATVTLGNADAAGGFALWWDRQKRVPLAGLLVGRYARRTLAVEEVGMMTGYAHRPTPWHGRAHLLLSHLNRDDHRLWRRILPGDLSLDVVDCDHHSIVREPHVGAVADVVAAARERPSAQPMCSGSTWTRTGS
jgi:acyl-coenzyme A synthetase/AMP-(fatty) acid ligase/thioesterase domain-containing protein/acyl carrier protein